MMRNLFAVLVACLTTCEAFFAFYDLRHFEMTSTPLLTSQLTLRCDVEVDYGATVIDLKIRKKSEAGYAWLAIASIGGIAQTNSFVDRNAEARGEIGPTSYLEVTWPDVPEEEAFGEYDCVAMLGTFGSVRVVRANELEVGSIEVLMEMIRILENGGELSNGIVSHAGDEPSSQDGTGGGAGADVVAGSGVTQEEFDDLNDRVNDLVSQLNSLEDAQGSTGTDVQETLDSLSEQITAFQQSRQEASDDVSNQIDSMSQQTISQLESWNNDDVQNQINALTQQLASLQAAAESIQDMNGQVSNVSGQIEVLRADLDNPINLNETLETVEGQVNDLETFLQSKPDLCDLRSLVWPQGRYSFLMPRTGCPQSELVAWAPGNRTHFTESSSGDNQNENSTADHMPLNLFTIDGNGYNAATLSFCSHVDISPGVPGFPRGSYCFHRRNNRCPDTSFTVGQLTVDDEGGARVNARAGALPQGSFRTDTVYYFCCRSDGSPDEAIRLPTAKPFYLYRHGGRCQNVYGMNVTNDYIVIDTSDGDEGNTGNGDRVTGTVPDGTINNLRLELCYYQRW